MFLETPYLDSPLARRLGIPSGGRGAPIVVAEALGSEIARAEDAGWQVAIHSQGDASGREVVRVFARAPERRAGALPRRMEHCGLIPVDLLPELARLGVSPSFHINHLYYYGDALADSILGAARADRLLPVRSAFELGLSPTLHADSPMFPAEPLSLVRTAVTRRTRSGRSIGADEAISIEQGLRAVTLNAARQLGMESEIGSLEIGKAADLVVLGADPYHVRPEDLTEIDVLGVWVAGRLHEPRSH
jgi:predicted amidohydrolase YtcJ